MRAITISQGFLGELTASWSRELEVGGLVFVDNARHVVSTLVELPNRAERPALEYRPDPGAVAAALDEALRVDLWPLVGWWHTHPFTRAVPSRDDRRTLRGVAFGLIVGSDGVRAWRHSWFSDAVEELELVVAT